ncbi:unnamed protein product [Malus fusca]
MPWVHGQLLKWVSHGIETIVLWKRFDAEEMAKMFNWEMKTLVIIMKQTKKNTRGPCRQLKTAKVTWVTNSRIPIGYNKQHLAVPTAEQHSALAHDIGHVVHTFCPMRWKSWKVMPDETKNTVRNQLFINYNLGDMDEDMFVYLNQLFSERYKPLSRRVVLRSWRTDKIVGFGFAKKAKVNKINREKKTLLHHSSSRPFSYRMEARRNEGSKFLEIDVFADVYVRPGNELTESLHATIVEKSQSVLQEFASQLPLDTLIQSVDPSEDARFHIVTETLDQTFGRRPGTYCRGIGNARLRESRASSSLQSKGHVTTLTQEVAGLRSELASYKSQMSMLVQALSSSRIYLPCFSAPSPSQPFHIEQAQHSGPSTSDPVPNQQQDLSNDIPIDFSVFFVPPFF